MKNKLKKQIEYCGLSYKSEIRKLVLINAVICILGLICYFFTQNLNIVISISVLGLVFDYLIISNY